MANKRPWEALDNLLIVKAGCVRILTILLILISAVGANTQSSRDSEIENLLKKLNKQPIKTLQSPDGEIIDCVDIFKQPAFDHPLLKNHTIEMRPSFDPGMVNRNNYSSEYVEPIWRQNGSCPKGTIPIRRVRKSDLFQAESFERFGMMHPNPYTNTAGRKEIAGAAMQSQSPLFYGVGGSLSVWKPRVYHEESSTSSITVVKRVGPSSIHTIYVGWAVHPRTFGDDLPHTYVAWMAMEGSSIRGCMNLFCPGFVQRNANIVLGSPLPFSGDNDLEVLQVKIYKSILDNWWVSINGLDVGYFPVEILPNFDLGTAVAWRGEVVNSGASGHHTVTQMGNGRFVNTNDGVPAHFENMVYADHYNHFIRARNLHIVAFYPRCYNAVLHPPPSGTSTPILFYGGSGGESCDE